jgi:small GTP-binding protein
MGNCNLNCFKLNTQLINKKNFKFDIDLENESDLKVALNLRNKLENKRRNTVFVPIKLNNKDNINSRSEYGDSRIKAIEKCNEKEVIKNENEKEKDKGLNHDKINNNNDNNNDNNYYKNSNIDQNYINDHFDLRDYRKSMDIEKKKDLKLTEVLKRKNFDFFEMNKGKTKINITLMGDKYVGKTSILFQYTANRFNNYYKNTIFKEDSTKDIFIKNKKYFLFINSLSGDSLYQGNYLRIYEITDFFLLVFDLTNKSSFIKIKDILEKEIIDHIGLIKNDFSNLLLIGNKCDIDIKEVTSQEITEFCNKYKIEYFEISAKNNLYLDKIFFRVAEIYHEIMNTTNDELIN